MPQQPWSSFALDHSHTLVKQLRQLRTPAERTRTGYYYIEGLHVVQRAYQSGVPLVLVVIVPTRLTTPAIATLVRQLRVAGLPVIEVSAADFDRISFKENRQGIGAVVRAQTTPIESVRPATTDLWVALDRVGNPGNLGAIMRTCDAVDCTGLLLLGDTADPYHPEAIRASMGALFSLQLVRTSFGDFTAWAQHHNYAVVGATPSATLDYRTLAYPSPLILLMGSERTGLSLEQQRSCTALTHIPMTGVSDSLNLAVSTSVILYEIFYQRQQHVMAGG